jgi:hypothetical protein
MEQILELLLPKMPCKRRCTSIKKTNANLKQMKASHEMRAWRKETKACLESKEPTPEEMANAVTHPEVPTKEAIVETIRALKDQFGDRHLAVERY